MEVPICANDVSLGKIYAIENELNTMPQAHCPVRHYFAGGIYAREMTIPGGVVLTGAVHRHEHLCTISQGTIMVSTDDGMKTLSAPHTIISKPGTKRVGYALETTVWTTYHLVGDERDLDKLMFEITESTNAQLMGGCENVQTQNGLAIADRADYQKFLDEYDLTQEVVNHLVENKGDRIEMPEEVTSVTFGPSKIHGTGAFSTLNIEMGSCVVPIRIKDKRTPAGWLINHSCRPNVAYVCLDDKSLMAVALKEIKVGDEICVDYRQAMSVNGAGFAPTERITE